MHDHGVAQSLVSILEKQHIAHHLYERLKRCKKAEERVPAAIGLLKAEAFDAQRH